MIAPANGFAMEGAQLHQARQQIQQLANERQGLYKLIGLLVRSIETGTFDALRRVEDKVCVRVKAVEEAKFVISIKPAQIRSDPTVPVEDVLVIDVKDAPAEGPRLVVPKGGV